MELAEYKYQDIKDAHFKNKHNLKGKMQQT